MKPEELIAKLEGVTHKKVETHFFGVEWISTLKNGLVQQDEYVIDFV